MLFKPGLYSFLLKHSWFGISGNTLGLMFYKVSLFTEHICPFLRSPLPVASNNSHSSIVRLHYGSVLWSLCFILVVLKGWLLSQHQHYLGSCYKCRFWVPISELPCLPRVSRKTGPTGHILRNLLMQLWRMGSENPQCRGMWETQAVIDVTVLR